MNNILYIVATPIGNLEDLSPRAREILRSVETVWCEDTRVSKKLLSAMGISTKTQSLHQHSSDRDIEKAIETLQKTDGAYISDAGTPNVSDPGGKLVAAAVSAGIEVSAIPGPSAAMTALSLCGFPADTFTFYGFPPHKKGRSAFFELVKNTPHTVVLFESKFRIEKTLNELPQDRPMMVARELTKLHETFYRGIAPQVLNQLAKSSQKGEYTIVLAPANWNV